MSPSSIQADPMSFRRLAHRFTVRCDDPAAAGYASRILRRFSVDGDAGGTSYVVQDRGPSASESRYVLLEAGHGLMVV